MFNISLLIKPITLKIFKEKMSFKPAIQRTIEDIRENDVRIQVTGYVKNLIEDESFILDDESGQISVNIQYVKFSFSEDDLVNVIGELDTDMEGERMLVAQIVQDMNKLNFKYYLKLYELKKQYG